ncbi:Rhodanese-like protein [Leucogyrophana mollusca]|uniref:Rhodanese-like protein n=1 Tax=Leucogyrophana mollusca TaxID=85980 RepID=A0ACB8B7I9_9AGAM|nr:Rhodanese-like protein [Leucogyrophana mollusca]
MPSSASSQASGDPDDRINDRLLSLALPHSPSSSRTLADIRDEVAQSLAVRAIRKAQLVDSVRVGVHFTFSKKDDDQFLQLVASHIRARLPARHLFALATTGPGVSTLVICGTDEDDVQRAVLLASSKFLGRVESVLNQGQTLVAAVRDIGSSSYDETALWDVVSKSVRAPMDPLSPPPGSRSIDRILSDARSKLQRVTPQQAYDELHDPTYPMPVFLVDIRPAAQREREGGIHGSLIIERNVLEWRFDPRCEARLAIADRYDLKIIVYCQEGYTSSLAAAALQELGLLNATDIVGGYAAWRQAGLPGQIKPPSTVSDGESYGLSQPSQLSSEV